MLWLAQIPASTPGEVGGWVLAAAAVLGFIYALLGIANQVRQFTAKPIEPTVLHDDRPVTHADVKKIEEEQKYMRERFHTLANDVHAIGLAQAKQPITMREMLDAALRPMQQKIDRMAVVTTAIGVKIGIPSVLDGEE